MANPKLSVLLSAYNAEKYVKEAVESILNQTFTDFELLIADDGSKDGTRDIIDSYTGDIRIKIHHNEVNLGKTTTINKLFQASIGEYITIHDADDISLNSRFAIQLNYLNSNDNLIMCGCNFMSFTEDGFNSIGSLEIDYSKIQIKILSESQFHGPTMIFKRQVITNDLKGDLLRPFFRDYNEDCDLAMRLTEVGECSNVNEVLYHYRILPYSLSKSITPRKKSLYPLLVELHNQRIIEGQDFLQKGETGKAEELLLKIQSEKYSDQSMIYRESAEFLMYYKLKSAAISQAWKSVRIAPLKLINWRTLQYCVRKFILE